MESTAVRSSPSLPGKSLALAGLWGCTFGLLFVLLGTKLSADRPTYGGVLVPAAIGMSVVCYLVRERASDAVKLLATTTCLGVGVGCVSSADKSGPIPLVGLLAMGAGSGLLSSVLQREARYLRRLAFTSLLFLATWWSLDLPGRIRHVRASELHFDASDAVYVLAGPFINPLILTASMLFGLFGCQPMFGRQRPS